MAKNWEKERSAVVQATQSIYDKQRQSQRDYWQDEADELEKTLEYVAECIHTQTRYAIEGHKLEMRERVLSELMDLRNSLTFARIEALKNAKKYEGG